MMIGVAQVIGMKPTLRSFFSIAPALREHLGRGLEREELRDRGERGRGADRFQERAARGVLRKHRAHHRRGDHALVALLLALDRRRIAAGRSVALVIDLADMAAARTARDEQALCGSNGLSNVDIGTRSIVAPGAQAGTSMNLQWACQTGPAFSPALLPRGWP